jgi:hypothetical protein
VSFTVTMSGVIVGRSELEGRDAETRIARGRFHPGLGYDLAQPVFALYEAASSDAVTLARYRTAREALRLQLTDAAGAPVSFRDLHILPNTDAKPGAKEYVIEIESDDPLIWNAPTKS